MFCKKCGNKFNNESVYCDNCGNKLRGDIKSDEFRTKIITGTRNIFRKLVKSLKWIGLIILALVIIASVVAFIISENDKKLERNVIVDIKYNLDKCPIINPLSVTVKNNTSKILEKVTYSIGVRRIGYSTDISSYLMMSKVSDKILNPGEQTSYCVRFNLQDGYLEFMKRPNELEFYIRYKNNQFQ